MRDSILQWAIRNRVSLSALGELRSILGINEPVIAATGESEAGVQSRVRLEAAHKGLKLWRNNVGVLQNAETGQPVRYGLANDSKRLNEVVKSGDLIGWRPVTITPAHVGTLIAQFVSRECKHPGWTYKGTDREKAQLRWAEAVIADGGDACFVSGEGTL